MTFSGLYPDHPILVIDDEKLALDSIRISLRSQGFSNVICLEKSKDCIELLKGQEVSLVLLDLWMPELSGEEVLAELKKNHPHIPVIITTADNQIETAILCMRQGAFDYLIKPINPEELTAAVRRSLRISLLEMENKARRKSLSTSGLKNKEAFAPIITQDSKMLTLFQYMEAISSSSEPVLVQGETGTGKELAVEVLHNLYQSSGPLLKCNTAGIDDQFFSDELFGHIKGAYTGAEQNRQGIIERAGKGTVFLDEIGDLRPASQLKLLRLLENREYYPVGSNIKKNCNARIIAATNQGLDKKIKQGLFRKDLYYRLCTHSVELPPLRERKSDIPLLARHFIRQAARDVGKEIHDLPADFDAIIQLYEFPGNVRELKALLYDAVGRSRTSTLDLSSFISKTRPQYQTSQKTETMPFINSGNTFPTLKQAERMLITKALELSDHNQSQAARILGISRQALNQRLHKNQTP